MPTLARFFALPGREQRLTVEAILSLLAVRLTFAVLSFPEALQLLRVVRGEPSRGRVAAAEAGEVGRAIARAARYVPCRAVCLQQAFAALLILRRRGLAATVHLGLAREADAGALKAHAWSRCGEAPVTGVEAARGFVAIAAFMA
jgi:hypothetical protein